MKVIPAVRNYSPHISQTGFILESIFALGLNIISLLQEKIYMDKSHWCLVLALLQTRNVSAHMPRFSTVTTIASIRGCIYTRLATTYEHATVND